MGHHALVAYERTDGTYNLHYGHWGGTDLRLKHEISEATPFGGDVDAQWAQKTHAALTKGAEPGDVREHYRITGSVPTDVEPLPLTIGVTFAKMITDHLDYCQHEAFYVVDDESDVTAYRTLWFGLQYDSETVDRDATVGNGALATVRWYNGEPVSDGYLRGQFRALKDVVGDMIDESVVAPTGARRYLKQKLREWVGERRELLFPTGESPHEGTTLGHS